MSSQSKVRCPHNPRFGVLTDLQYIRMINPLIHHTAIIDEGCSIGEGTQIWHFSHLMKSSVVGNNCVIGQNVFIGVGVVLGNRVKVQNNVSVYTGVVCEDDVFLGPSMVFTNVINPRSFVSRKAEFKNTLVKKGASIGANATIICGNILGAYCMIGAGSVVTKNVSDYALMVGNPAKQIGWVSEQGHRLIFSNDGVGHCPETKDAYLLKDNKVEKQAK